MRLLELLAVPKHIALSHDLAQALDALVARAPQFGADQLLVKLDEVEATHLRKIPSSRKQQIETKRRVAEWKFKLLSERDLTAQRVDVLYRQVCDLGFTDLESEATIQIYFAQYCVRKSRVQDAQKVIDALCLKLQQASAVDGPEIYAHLLQDARRILP